MEKSDSFATSPFSVQKRIRTGIQSGADKSFKL